MKIKADKETFGKYGCGGNPTDWMRHQSFEWQWRSDTEPRSHLAPRAPHLIKSSPPPSFQQALNSLLITAAPMNYYRRPATTAATDRGVNERHLPAPAPSIMATEGPLFAPASFYGYSCRVMSRPPPVLTANRTPSASSSSSSAAAAAAAAASVRPQRKTRFGTAGQPELTSFCVHFVHPEPLGSQLHLAFALLWSPVFSHISFKRILLNEPKTPMVNYNKKKRKLVDVLNIHSFLFTFFDITLDIRLIVLISGKIEQKIIFRNNKRSSRVQRCE